MARDLIRLAEQGERLKKLRRPLPGTGRGGNPVYEVSQQAAADAAGVKLRAYQAYEGGTSDIGLEAVDGLAAFFGVSAAYIREGEGGPTQLDRVEAMLSVLIADRGLDDRVEELLKASHHGAPIPSEDEIPFAAALAHAEAQPDEPTPAKKPAAKASTSDQKPRRPRTA